MNVVRALLFLFVAPLLLFPQATPSELIAADEGRMRIEIGTNATLKLPVVNAGNKPISAPVELAFLDTGSRPALKLRSTMTIAPGSSIIEMPLAGFLELEEARAAHYGWMRLKYRLGSDAAGIVSVSRLAPEPFILTVARSYVVRASAGLRLQIFASDPLTRKPVSNVQITANVSPKEESQRAILRTARTNSNGLAIVELDYAALGPDSSFDLEIQGRIGKFVRRVSDNVRLYGGFSIITTTDKPIYQPGQKLRARILAIDELNGVAKGKPITVTIEDPGNDDVMEVSLVTSSFGEAHIEWDIPENARSGEYTLGAIASGADARGFARVWIGAYDLPNFTINVRRDRPFYLPGQNAEIDIQTQYLSGKNVPGARVRVTRETSRTWDYRTGKWKVEQGPSLEGTADNEGRFHTSLKLEEGFEQLTERDGASFSDLDWTAYVTDPSTGRTEERRFAVRVTRFPVHIYALLTDQAEGLPMEFYVAASYADGTPASCDVEVFEALDDTRVLLTTVRTNQYGVGKVSSVRLPAEFMRDGVQPKLELRARDSAGKVGQRFQSFHLRDEALRLYTNRVFYRDNEAIDVSLESTARNGTLILNAVHGNELVHSAVLQLAGGKARARIPYSSAFAGAVTVLAYDPANLRYMQAERQVLYPGIGELQVETSAGKPSYAPGEEATLRFRLRNADGSPHAGLLGVTVLDKAVEERVQATSQFGNPAWCCATRYNPYSSIGSITRGALDRVDRARPIAADLELAAEALLQQQGAFDIFDEVGDDETVARAFSGGLVFRVRFEKQRKAGARYPSGATLPSDEASLRVMVRELDPDFDGLRDPWDMPYRLKPSVIGRYNHIEIVSAGPDKQFDTADDFAEDRLSWDYFTNYAVQLERALNQHHARTGGYIRDFQTLKAELSLQGQDFDAWRDPRGGRFSAEFSIQGPRFVVTVRDKEGVLWTGGVAYTVELDAQVNNALNAFIDREKVIPETEAAFKAALATSGVNYSGLRDPWGRQYYTLITDESAYLDDVSIVSRPVAIVTVTPVSQELRVIRMRSAGPDGTEGTPDDFSVVSILKPLTQQSVSGPQPLPVDTPTLRDGKLGGLYGLVIDNSGARLPGAGVTITNQAGVSRSMLTDDNGDFMFRDIEPGQYRLRIEFTGFHSKTFSVQVTAGSFTRVISALEIGSVTQTVMVEASRRYTFSPILQPQPESLSTPRLREYFPETLFWQPALETNSSGLAEARFKLADNITTWKAKVIASTRDGRFAFADAEFTAFQPFFVEHDPPKSLTEGDRIALPVVVRNYLDRDQSLDLSMKPEAWFAALDTPSRQLDIAANESRREVFAFEARTPVRNGPQQIHAIGSSASDAIVKTSTVLPFGREMTQVSSETLRTSTLHNVAVPSNALAGTIHAEIKVYPNLMAHVVNGIEAIMRRPHGCAEQVTSAAYPSLLYLRYRKAAGGRKDALSDTAITYVKAAIQVLRGYRASSGGFAYWTHGDPDPAVTAYALQFLSDAREFVAVDDELIGQAYLWLANNQRTDGSWSGDLAATAYIAQVLSAPGVRRSGKDPVPAALAYLQTSALPPSPYVRASLALAALNIGDRKLAESALATIKAQALTEGDAVFWDLQTNTPFYGWGLPGLLETTAIAVRALAAAGMEPALVDKGLLFLLRNKDELGIWYSTQATVRVLEALSVLVESPQGKARNVAGTADVRVNGVIVTKIAFGSGAQRNNPVTVDISRFLSTGANRIEVTADKKAAAATVQLVEGHYVPWDATATDLRSGALRFAVRFDKREGPIGEAIGVHVDAERIGFRGYGMMTAEIGLPPGADVDRESLAFAAEQTGWELARYDILSDRVIVYLWPRAGGTSFEFKFRPRFGVNAHTPSSKLYDYYNPDARVILLPERFVVE